MTPERWQQIEDLYNQVLDNGPSVLAETDPDLKREVEALLLQDAPRTGILDRSVDGLLQDLSTRTLAAGTQLGPYQIERLVGSGGMGEVYVAQDTRLQRTVAIKVLSFDKFPDRQALQRFRQEAKALSRLQHPNICVVHDIGTQGDIDFIVMEYVAGQTLSNLLPRHGLPAAQSLDYALQIAEALAYVHKAGIVHRDLKPANIIVNESGLVKVLDFGLAQLTSNVSQNETVEMLTQPGMILGTVSYMSPEQATGKPIDARSDIFSFGAVFYEMLTGSKAFQSASIPATLLALVNSEPAPIHQLRKDVSPEICQILNRCLSKNADDRFASGSELAREMAILRESGAGLSIASLVRQVRGPRVLIPILLTLLCAVIGTIWLVKHSQDVRLAREVSIPEAAHLTDLGRLEDAYTLAVKAEKLVPADAMLGKLWPAISFPLSVNSKPSGAKVFRRDYASPNAAWEFVGTTPLENLRQPRGAFL